MDRNAIDPITVEVLRNYFVATAREMRSILIKTSFNSIIYEVKDFAVSIYSKAAELVAQDPGIPVFVGSLDHCIRSILEHLGRENIHDGDVILSSYPIFSGSHQNDVAVVKPVFVDGEIFAYTTCKAHWIDIAGINIFSVDTTDIYQEGLILPAVKVVKRGKVDKEIMDIIGFNTRFRDVVIGDVNAEIACCEAGASRILRAVEKYGKEVVEGAIEQFLDNSEKLTRQVIAQMPDGEWSAEGFLDNDGVGDTPVPLKVTVRIKGDNIEFDTTGTAGPTKGPVNSPYAGTVSWFKCILMTIVNPYYEPNEGCFRPLKVIAPEGSLANARAPSAMSFHHVTAEQLSNLVHKALSEAIPDRVVARSGGTYAGFVWSVKSPRDGSSVGGGQNGAIGEGAGIDNDGENALVVWDTGDCYNVPVEVFEERYPFFVERFALRENSGGAGKFRGGLGTELIFKAEDEINAVLYTEQTKFPGWGLFGGKSGLPNVALANPGTKKEKSGKGNATLQTGEYLVMKTGGGGGFGDPYERDTARVLDDVLDGYITVESARDDFGVVIRKEGSEYVVDQEETKRLRKKIRVVRT